MTALTGPAPGPSFVLESFIRQMDHAYHNWRYYAPPTGSSVYSSAERFVTQAEIPDVEPVLMCEARIGSGSVAVISKFGVEAIEYPRDAGGRTFAQALPPTTMYNLAKWFIRFQQIENPLSGAGRNIGAGTPLDGMRIFEWHSSHNGATPIIQPGPGTLKIFMQVEGLGLSPYQVPEDGLSFTARLDGYTVPLPTFTPKGFPVGQPPPEPWNSKS